MMADSENDPGAGATPAGNSAAASPETPKPLSKIPRVSPPTIAQRREESSGATGSKVNLEDLITWLRDGASGGTKPGAAEAQQSTLSKEKRKFRRYDPPPARAAEPAGGAATESATETPTEMAGGTAAAASPEAAGAAGGSRGEETPAALAEFVPKGTRRPASARTSLFSSLGLQVGALVLMVACFFLGRATVPVAAPAPAKRPAATAVANDPATHSLSDATLGVLDQAIAAEGAGDTKKADALYDQLKNGPEHISGLDYQIGWLDYQTGRSAAAALAVNQSIAEGENVGESYGLRGLMRSRLGPAKSVRDFEIAAKASPFDAASFFHWGEALRRAGKPRAALIRLREAVERAPTPEDVATYDFKVRLTQIELGEEKDFADQLAAQLASPHPRMEWVLTAAAEDMHNGNYAAAAADLNRARESADPARLALALGDYFFAGYAEKEPLRGIFAEIISPPAAAVPAAGTASNPLAAPAAAAPFPAATP